MMKHSFRRVKEGSFRYGMNMILVGIALVPMSHMTAQTPPEVEKTWQTELSLADKQPELLAQTSGVTIEKVTSRYQASIDAAQKQTDEKKAKVKRTIVLAKKPVSLPDSEASSNTCHRDVSEAEKVDWVNRAAAAYNIPPSLLRAVWQVESGQQFCTGVKSYAGAQGPMQFVLGTWRKYAKDGNGDGVSNINDARDALFAGAHLLAANGADKGDYRRALFAYNHSDSYVNKVLQIAQI